MEHVSVFIISVSVINSGKTTREGEASFVFSSGARIKKKIN